MKKTLFILCVVSPILFGSTQITNLRPKKQVPLLLKEKPIQPTSVITPNIDALIPALIEVESLGNDSAIGDRHLVGEEAVGALQIRPIMVREVNRILKLKRSKIRYTRKDRFSREKSIEMFLIWQEFHHKDSDFEKISRNWNGGPRGFKSSRTEHYWKKVKKQLEL